MHNKFSFLILILTVVLLSSCKQQEPRLPVSVSSGVDYTESIELSKKINQREERKFRKYVAKQNLEFKRSNFGFLYHIKNNSTQLIESKDDVKFTEIIEDLDGEIIYQSVTKNLVVDHQEEIKGMHEGLKLMSEGAEATFIFPSHQAFGFHGDDNKIKSNTPLVYKIKVLKVNNIQINN